ncbi:MAG: hypothetical protein ACI8RZ_003485, partial [Myxococcota bacterium]
TEKEAGDIYTALKQEAQPRSASEMASLWVTEVRTRKATLSEDLPELQAV